MLKKIIAVVTLGSAAMLGMLLVFTTPAGVGPLGILGFFVFLYMSALGALTFLFFTAGRLAARAPAQLARRLPLQGVSFQKSYYYASVVALAPIMLLAMQSVGEVGFYQLLLVILFVVIAWVYVAKRTT